VVECASCGREIEVEDCLVEIVDEEELCYCSEACRDQARQEPEAAPAPEDEPRAPVP
jgi:hypothetical protein